ncbi:Avirulence induced-like protein [Thalictrum thalictroides]|uniref:Gamma-glutamylcyclotransferase family protein n=1 Tax=Thalictrum thalictroides TaxID=46969 RepID=A0A7J6WHY6_THATH|nr:Avirulence induced-like protein [Thalictrum thalictroides]
MGVEEELQEEKSFIFTYGTLKHGFANHVLMQDLISTKDAVYLGVYRTIEKYPLVCGPYRVPFLLNFPGSGDRIWGELYAVSQIGLSRMDELEGITRNHYERLPIEVVRGGVDGTENVKVMKAEAYYGHKSFAQQMWKKNGEKGFCEYNQQEALGYVKRKDRPVDVTFVDQIRLFVSSSSD